MSFGSGSSKSGGSGGAGSIDRHDDGGSFRIDFAQFWAMVSGLSLLSAQVHTRRCSQ
jgi:hypothetical protein